ncbi:ECF transporter S component [Microbacterium sp. C5A9]|uniref:ECF transporter S component n=1 Tax=Microbacterium sp. C5A9 TaxID=2736663 RepID=UPI001F51A8F9|nr:ECF transporter S component [Microbacterium sp. C5A9]MCI1019916.1 ECF transporter S component [Microbacterium sp. C5A9]
MSGADPTHGAGPEAPRESPSAAPNRPRIGGGRSRFRFPTAILLTCAALGVAGGILLAPANWISTVLFPGLPFVSVGLAGLWLLPSVIALRLLRRPLVGLLVGLLAGLVIVPFSGYGFGSVATNVWWAAFTELPFLFVLWRYWGTWMHYLGAAIVGIVYPILAWASFDLGTFGLGLQITFFAITLASCLGGTALGILIADRLRKAGVGGRLPR